VHRLDKETSGLILVAKNDPAHRALGALFSKREVEKTYIALVHGWPQKDRGTISSSISRDSVRRIRMTTRGSGGREAITHYQMQKRIASPFGKFALVEVKIDTGRTHQIRIHMSSLGHPVVGDALYGAPREVRGGGKGAISLARNFLHAAALQFQHPKTGETMSFSRPLPSELQVFLDRVESDE
jgi:23S rRNA pseudouridine1911/1915/1917 synthase